MVNLKFWRKKLSDKAFRTSFKFPRRGWDQRPGKFSRLSHIETRNCYSCLVLHLDVTNYSGCLMKMPVLIKTGKKGNSLWQRICCKITSQVVTMHRCSHFIYSIKFSQYVVATTCFTQEYFGITLHAWNKIPIFQFLILRTVFNFTWFFFGWFCIFMNFRKQHW